jgi:hypothetical protein
LPNHDPTGINPAVVRKKTILAHKTLFFFFLANSFLYQYNYINY